MQDYNADILFIPVNTALISKTVCEAAVQDCNAEQEEEGYVHHYRSAKNCHILLDEVAVVNII